MHRNEYGMVTIDKERFDSREARITELEDAIRHLAVGRMPDSRAQAVALIHEQFKRSRPCPSKKGRHYYGAQELKELLDAIYGGPPATDAEKIKGSPMGGFDKVR